MWVCMQCATHYVAARVSYIWYLKASLPRPVCMLVEGPHICQAGMQVQGLRYNDGHYEQG